MIFVFHVTELNVVHALKTEIPMDVTEFGILIDANDVQPSKIESPIVEIDFPNVTSDNLLHR